MVHKSQRRLRRGSNRSMAQFLAALAPIITYTVKDSHQAVATQRRHNALVHALSFVCRAARASVCDFLCSTRRALFVGGEFLAENDVRAYLLHLALGLPAESAVVVYYMDPPVERFRFVHARYAESRVRVTLSGSSAHGYIAPAFRERDVISVSGKGLPCSVVGAGVFDVVLTVRWGVADVRAVTEGVFVSPIVELIGGGVDMKNGATLTVCAPTAAGIMADLGRGDAHAVRMGRSLYVRAMSKIALAVRALVCGSEICAPKPGRPIRNVTMRVPLDGCTQARGPVACMRHSAIAVLPWSVFATAPDAGGRAMLDAEVLYSLLFERAGSVNMGLAESVAVCGTRTTRGGATTFHLQLAFDVVPEAAGLLCCAFVTSLLRAMRRCMRGDRNSICIDALCFHEYPGCHREDMRLDLHEFRFDDLRRIVEGGANPEEGRSTAYYAYFLMAAVGAIRCARIGPAALARHCAVVRFCSGVGDAFPHDFVTWPLPVATDAPCTCLLALQQERQCRRWLSLARLATLSCESDVALVCDTLCLDHSEAPWLLGAHQRIRTRELRLRGGPACDDGVDATEARRLHVLGVEWESVSALGLGVFSPAIECLDFDAPLRLLYAGHRRALCSYLRAFTRVLEDERRRALRAVCAHFAAPPGAQGDDYVARIVGPGTAEQPLYELATARTLRRALRARARAICVFYRCPWTDFDGRSLLVAGGDVPAGLVVRFDFDIWIEQ